MNIKFKFSQEDYDSIKSALEQNRDNQIDKRLRVLELRCQGMAYDSIAEATGFQRSYVGSLIRKYFEEGLASISEKHYKGNHRNMSIEEEIAFLELYQQKAQSGQKLSTREIASAYQERVGHKISSGQIYRVLRRHNWR